MKSKRKTLSRIEKKELPIVYAMLAPAVILLGIFVLWPLVMAIDRSFYDWTFYKESTYIGLESYRIIINNPYFQQSIINSLKFIVLIVPSMMILAFFLANLIRGVSQRAANIVKSILYIPSVVSGIAASVIFILVLDYRGGIVNQVLQAMGRPRFAYQNSAWAASVTVALITIWLGIGGNTILMFAAMTNIPREYYEASAIDGANRWQQMVNITLPQMRNIFVLIAVSLTTATLQMFDIPFMLTGGGPMNKTLMPVLYLYNNYRDASKGMGYTIAGALLIMVIIVAINLVIFRVIRSEKLVDN